MAYDYHYNYEWNNYRLKFWVGSEDDISTNTQISFGDAILRVKIDKGFEKDLPLGIEKAGIVEIEFDLKEIARLDNGTSLRQAITDGTKASLTTYNSGHYTYNDFFYENYIEIDYWNGSSFDPIFRGTQEITQELKYDGSDKLKVSFICTVSKAMMMIIPNYEQLNYSVVTGWDSSTAMSSTFKKLLMLMRRGNSGGYRNYCVYNDDIYRTNRYQGITLNSFTALLESQLTLLVNAYKRRKTGSDVVIINNFNFNFTYYTYTTGSEEYPDIINDAEDTLTASTTYLIAISQNKDEEIIGGLLSSEGLESKYSDLYSAIDGLSKNHINNVYVSYDGDDTRVTFNYCYGHTNSSITIDKRDEFVEATKPYYTLRESISKANYTLGELGEQQIKAINYGTANGTYTDVECYIHNQFPFDKDNKFYKINTNNTSDPSNTLHNQRIHKLKDKGDDNLFYQLNFKGSAIAYNKVHDKFTITNGVTSYSGVDPSTNWNDDNVHYEAPTHYGYMFTTAKALVEWFGSNAQAVVKLKIRDGIINYTDIGKAFTISGMNDTTTAYLPNLPTRYILTSLKSDFDGYVEVVFFGVG